MIQDDEVVFDVLIRTGIVNPIGISLAESLLEEAGIPFLAVDQNVAARQEGGNPGGWWTVRVSKANETEAREIISAVESMK